LLFLCVSSLSGCAALWTRRIPGEILSSPDLFQRIQARNRQIHSIKAQARVVINLGEHRFSLEELLIIKKPASLRVEAFSPIGQPLLYLITDGKVLEALVPAENRLYRGEAVRKYLSPFFPFPHEPGRIISLMMGELGWTDDERLVAQYNQRHRVYLVEEDTLDAPRRVVWIDPFHFAPVRATEIDELNNPRWEILFADFRKKDGIPFPTDIEFRSSSPKSRMTMHLLDWEINPSLGEEVFRLDVPRGVEIIDMK
jgi:outer membrane lipoprotein-sorting protein